MIYYWIFISAMAFRQCYSITLFTIKRIVTPQIHFQHITNNPGCPHHQNYKSCTSFSSGVERILLKLCHKLYIGCPRLWFSVLTALLLLQKQKYFLSSEQVIISILVRKHFSNDINAKNILLKGNDLIATTYN